VSDQIEGLYVVLTAQNGPMLASFAEAGAAGSAMSVRIGTAMSEVTTVIERGVLASTNLAESVGRAAAKTSAGYGGLAIEVTAAMSEVTAATERGVLASTALASSVESMALQSSAGFAAMSAAHLKMTGAMEKQAARAATANAAMATKIDEVAAQTEVAAAASTAAMTKKLAKISAAGLIVSGVVIGMAGNFESATNRLVTSAGESHDAIDMVRAGILQMAGEVGNSAGELAKAMYTVESGGQHGADGLKVLRAAAEGAKAENAELATVADAVTSILQDYHLKADSAALVTSKLVAATSVGKTSFEELTGSLSSILPIASSAKISIDDILGALASMTVHGMSAAQASQNMADAVKHMLAPTQVQAKELGQLGMSAQDLAGMLSEKGLTGTVNTLSETILQHMGPSGKVMLNAFNQSKDAAGAVKTMIASMPPGLKELSEQYMAGSMSAKDWSGAIKKLPTDQAMLAKQFASTADRARGFTDVLKSGQPAAQSYQDALRRVMGDATGLNVALMLTGENTEYVTHAVKTVAGATTEAGGHVAGWKDIQGTFNQQLARAKDGLGALAVAIGMKLLPAVTKIAGVLGDAAEWLVKHDKLATALAVVVGSLTVAFTLAAAATWVWNLALWANPVGLVVLAVVAAIAVLAAAVYLVVAYWDDITNAFVVLWRYIVNGVKDIGHWFADLGRSIGRIWDASLAYVSRIWDGIVSYLSGAWRRIQTLFMDGAKAAVDVLRPVLEPIIHTFENVFRIVYTIISTAVEIWGIILLAGSRKIVSLATSIWRPIANFFSDLWDDISRNLREVWDSVSSWVSRKWNETATVARYVWRLVKENVVNPVAEIWHDIQDKWNRVKSFLDDAWRRISDIVSRGAQQVWDKVRGLGRNLLDTVSGWGGLLLGAGAQLVMGIIHGIENKSGELLRKVQNLASEAVASLKRALDIKSPSRVMASEVGEHIPTGIAQGVTSASRIAVRAAQDMAEQVVTGARAGLSGSTHTISPTTGLGFGGGSPSPLHGANTQSALGQVLNIYLTVQGSLLHQDDLQQIIQKIVLRYANRNPSAGWTPAFT
jgi:hypothetical protein